MDFPSLTLTSPNLDRVVAIPMARHQMLLLTPRSHNPEFALLAGVHLLDTC